MISEHDVVVTAEKDQAATVTPPPLPDLLAGAGFSLAFVGGLAGHELARRMAVAVRGGEVCHRALAFYLHDMETRHVHFELGFATAVDFARHRLGMSKGRARDLLLTGRKLSELPRLDAAFAAGELSWSKVRRIARVATAETEAVWIARARDATHEEVDALVSVAKEGETPKSLERGLPATRFVKRFVLDAMQHELFEKARAKLQAELGRAVTDGDVLDDAVRLLLGSSPDGSVAGRRQVDESLFRVVVDEKAPEATSAPRIDEPAAEAARSDAVPSPRLRRRVLARDGHRCRACESQRHLMLHHVVWRSHGGPTTLDNIVTLCSRCHGLVHDGFLLVEHGEQNKLRFADRDGHPLHRRHAAAGSAITLIACAAAHATAPSTAGPQAAGALRSEADIPDVVDAAWWRAHEHELEWTSRGVRVKAASRRAG